MEVSSLRIIPGVWPLVIVVGFVEMSKVIVIQEAVVAQSVLGQ